MWYQKYARNQRTLEDIAKEIGVSKQTLQQKFDALCVCTGECSILTEALIVTMDATNISNVGILTLLRDTKKHNLFWHWSTTEKVEHYERCLRAREGIGDTFTAMENPGFVKCWSESILAFPPSTAKSIK